MNFQQTPEQQAIINLIQQPDTTLVAVNSVSGSGKTSLLQSIVETLQPKTSLYLAYNNAIATEASHKFPSATVCKTTHALAYANTVKAYNLKIDNFTYRSITDKVSYEIKLEVASFLSEFCLSSALSIEEFTDQRATSSVVSKLANSYLDKMQSGKTPASHAFYLKFYHLLLATGAIGHEEFDLIMLDEAGDLNPVTLAIFELLDAKKKIMVGDENQNIYSFNNTINGFEVIGDKAIHMSMTKSFRVSAALASEIQGFCRVHLKPTMVFEGVEYDDMTITTTAFLARTNSALVGEMIELNKIGKAYNLTRPPEQIFKLPRTLIGLKPGKFVAPEFKHLQEDANYYFENYSKLSGEYKTLFSYLLDRHPDDIELKSAVNLITKHGSHAIIQAFEHSKSHKKTKNTHTLCTIHSSKGLEWDEVKIGEDMNTVMNKISGTTVAYRTPEQHEECRLYYVAVTRARKSLINARHLNVDDSTATLPFSLSTPTYKDL